MTVPSDTEPSTQQTRRSQLARGSGLTFRHCGFCLQKSWSGKASWRRGRGRCCNLVNGVYSGNRTTWRGVGRAGEAGAGKQRDRRRGKVGSLPCILGGSRRGGAGGSMDIRPLFLPWSLPCVAVSPGLPSALTSSSCPSLHTPGVREVTAGILITPVKPNPPFVQTSELSQKPRPLGPRTEGADAAVSAFPERMPGLPWQVSMNSHFLRHLWGISGCDSPSPAPPG